ncbi:uncharacterized protein [Embiotoca jacksoni]|uniref:uncharacterized protein n=1 Tax=Embiotoca jacksoni TaxID=100190 RepID=UPI003703AF6B
MKPWSRLCFLVLAICWISQGRSQTTVSLHEADAKEPEGSTNTMTETEKEATSLTPSAWSSQSPASATFTVTAATDPEKQTQKWSEDVSHEGGTSNETTQRAATSVPGNGREGHVTSVSTATIITSSGAVQTKDTTSWAYVFLVLILLVIIVLCVILYFLRRVSRTYSFDLQRPTPVERLNQGGTFEPVYLDDLERPATTIDDLSPSPVANGTSLPSEEKGSGGENAGPEQPDENGVEASPASPSLLDELSDPLSDPLSRTDLLFDAIVEQMNENNNNNPSLRSTDPFVEINLDEPAWCDQLLTSPSSVLPFSFSSSSSSSSSSS